MKFELDQADVETILDALRDRRHQLQNEIRQLGGQGRFLHEVGGSRELLNEVCVTEEKIRHQQSWGID